MNISKPKRQFVSSELTINDWNQIETYFIDLEERDLDSLDQLKEWLVAVL